MNYPGTNFPSSVDALNPIGPGSADSNVPNLQGETHAGIHAQLAAALMAVENYILGGSVGVPGLGQGVHGSPTPYPYTITASDRGKLVYFASGVSPAAILPAVATSGIGPGFVVAIANAYGIGSDAVPVTGATFLTPQGTSLTEIDLKAGESVILMAIGGTSWMIVGGSGTYAQATAVCPLVVALTDAATISTDARLGNDFTVTLLGNHTFAAPTNPTNGQKILIQITQGAGGPWTPAFNAIFDFGGITPTWSTTVGQVDYLLARYDSVRTKWDVLSVQGGY